MVSRRWRLAAIFNISLAFFAACSERVPSRPPPFLGTWRSAAENATLEFLENGTVTIGVENTQVQYSFSASWRLLDSTHIRLTPPAGLPEAVLPRGAKSLTIAVVGDRLTLSGNAGTTVAYDRVPNHVTR